MRYLLEVYLMMKITDDERLNAEYLKKIFLAHREKLSYANITSSGAYAGWVSDFRLRDGSGNKVSLDLKNQEDLFLLFVLAVAWSRPGMWENAAFFVTWLKVSGKNTPSFWLDFRNCDLERQRNVVSAREIISLVNGIDHRKKIFFRKDIYDSVHILARKWGQILDRLQKSGGENDFYPFMDYIRDIEGLGTGNKKMLIKIPLILRELKCQNIYDNIPGKYCCVPDGRVRDAARALKIRLPISNDLSALTQSSAKIYSLFGELYDLPFFAYVDLLKLA